MKICCKICNDIIEFSNARGISKFTKHLKTHDIDAKTYFDTYLQTNTGICPICNKETKFLSVLRGYAVTCSTKCGRIYSLSHITKESVKKSILNMQKTKINRYGDPNYNNHEKTLQTKLEKYGDAHYNNFEKCKLTKEKRYGNEYYVNHEKARKTCLELYNDAYFTNREKCFDTFETKYGTRDIFKLQTVKDKIKSTKLEKYGDEFYNNRGKCENTCQLNYGVSNVFQTEFTKEKIKETNLTKYGVEHIFKSEQVQEHIKNTNIERYGVENPMQNKEIFNKSHSKYNFDNRLFDSSWELIYYIWLKDHNIDFEYQPPIFFKYSYNNIEHIYNPDFLVNGQLYEIKGLQFFKDKNPNNAMINPFDRTMDDLYEAKHQCMINNNVKIITDITEYVNYINKTYTKDFVQLFKTNIPFPYPDNDIIKKYHHSIYDAHVNHKPSPITAWTNKNLVYKAALNRLKYKNRCTPSDILEGFNVTKIAPKVSVFKRQLAKRLIETYLNEFNIIFDPFSGFSGRMLGTCDCGKQYIGQDINQNHVKESNQIIHDLKLNAYVYECNIFESSFNYECLFTCPPYNLKEIWNKDETNLTCDEWIDVCLERFNCKKYLFVVDNTVKYKDYIVETLTNKSHFSNNNEYVILI